MRRMSRFLARPLATLLALAMTITGMPGMPMSTVAAATVHKLTYAFNCGDGVEAPTKDGVELTEPVQAVDGTATGQYYKRSGSESQWTYTKEATDAVYDGTSEYFEEGVQ